MSRSDDFRERMKQEASGELEIPGVEANNPGDLLLMFRTAVETLEDIKANDPRNDDAVQVVALVTATALSNWLQITRQADELRAAPKGRPN